MKMNGKTIVIIDDDCLFAQLLQTVLKQHGYQVFIIDNVQDANNYLQHSEGADLFILDYDLNDSRENGRDLCRKIKAYISKPILMLTGESSSEAIVSCLYAGADYYETKPYKLNELLAKIHAILRSQTLIQSMKLNVRSGIEKAGLVLRQDSRTLMCTDKIVQLTEREASLAEVLLMHYNEELNRQVIFSAVFGGEMDRLSRAVDILVGRLRKKIQVVSDEFLILPSSGGNYKLIRRDQMGGAEHNFSTSEAVNSIAS